jgi:broad specificity phosphatase PhoE
MRTLRLSLVLGLLVALLPALPAQAQETVFLIRHAERDWAEDGGLVEEGRQRANAWGEALADAELDVIITSEKRRTRETGQPIADMLDVPILAISRYDFDGLLETLAADYGDDRVLIVSHSSSIPQILRLMGHPDSVYIPKTDYDDLFVVHPDEDGTPDVIRLNVEWGQPPEPPAE